MVLKSVNLRMLKEDKFDPLIVTKENMLEQIGVDSSNYVQVTFERLPQEAKMILVGTGKWEGLTAYGTVDELTVVLSEGL